MPFQEGDALGINFPEMPERIGEAIILSRPELLTFSGSRVKNSGSVETSFFAVAGVPSSSP